MTEPTKGQVEALVTAAMAIHDAFDRGRIIRPLTGYSANLAAALEPFRPDPDAEVIEAMVKAYCNQVHETYLQGKKIEDERPIGMRAALAAYREHEGRRP